MDRYELNVKIEQIKKLARQKDFATAARAADTIDFYRIKENRSLSLLADVYEASGRYQQAKDILIEAYARTSLGRQLAYRLVKLCIKSGNVSEAEEFYQDFIEAAPRDNSKYILQYELASAKGEPLENRISILETYLEDEMDERWAFELARLYHKTGQKDKCVNQCDDIILWFSEGKYVDKAMELKMIYAPLTKSQQAKYEERWMAKAPSGINVEEIKVKEFDAGNRYNTVNIQDALKESMHILMNEETEAPGEEQKEPDSDIEKTKVVFTDDVVNQLLSHTVKDVRVPESKYHTVPLAPLFDMASDGQIELSIEEEPVDEQIEGQMTIEELLNAYEERETREASCIEIPQVEVSSMEAPQMEAPQMEVPEMAFVTADLGGIESALKEAAAAFADEESGQEKNENPDVSADENQETNDEDGNIDMNPEEEAEDELDEYVKAELEAEIKEDEDTEEDTLNDEQEEIAEEETDLKNEDNTDKIDNNIVKELIKEFVSKYSGVQGLDRQLLLVLQETLINGNARIVVMGEVKSGKTALAIDLVKIVNKIRQIRGRKIAKINGQILNGKSVADYFEKLSGMDLIIEKAGALSTATVEEILSQIQDDEDNKIVVLEDEKTNAQNLLDANSSLGDIFKGKVVVKQNKVRDWAAVAREYAKENEYEIDEMGMLALHAKIDALYAISFVINKSQVEEIVDDAMEKSQRRGFGKLLKLVGKEREKILRENDFV